MRSVIQRVINAEVKINDKSYSSIDSGLLILIGIEETDDDEDIEWLCSKILNLRIFNDEQGLMNKSVIETNSEILIVSQFTLYASTKKGNRPGFTKSAKPIIAIPLYDKVISVLKNALGHKIKTGVFGADMKVSLVNDGPVTIIIDTKNKE